MHLESQQLRYDIKGPTESRVVCVNLQCRMCVIGFITGGNMMLWSDVYEMNKVGLSWQRCRVIWLDDPHIVVQQASWSCDVMLAMECPSVCRSGRMNGRDTGTATCMHGIIAAAGSLAEMVSFKACGPACRLVAASPTPDSVMFQHHPALELHNSHACVPGLMR